MRVEVTTQEGPAEAPSSPEPVSRPGRLTVLNFFGRFGTLVFLALMIIYFGVTAPESFLTGGNALNIVSQSSLTAIVSCGLTLVLVVGEFDMSIGYLASFGGIVATGMLLKQGLPLWGSFAAVLIVGLVVGLVNGILVTKVRVNAVIATLGVGTALVGLSYDYTAGSPIAGNVPSAFLALTIGRTAGVPNPIWFMLVTVSLLYILLNHTDLGERIQAVGGNREAAKLSGISVDRIKIICFVLASVCAALTGLLLASLTGSGTVSAGDGYLLDAFAAVFLGSATLRDGEFNILGTVIGVLIINTGFNGLSILAVPVFYQYIFKGGLLVLAVALSSVARRYARN